MMTKKIWKNNDMKDNIKALYKKVVDKITLRETLADEFGKTYNTISNHWLGGGFSVPEEHQARVVEILQNTVRSQEDKKAAIHG